MVKTDRGLNTSLQEEKETTKANDTATCLESSAETADEKPAAAEAREDVQNEQNQEHVRVVTRTDEDGRGVKQLHLSLSGPLHHIYSSLFSIHCPPPLPIRFLPVR